VPLDRQQLAALQGRADRLRQTAEQAQQVIQLEQETLLAFQATAGATPDSAAMRAFLDQVAAADRKEREVLDAIVVLYDEAAQARLEERMRGRRGYLGVHEFLAEEITALEAQQRQITATLDASKLSLRLSAYLDSPGREPARIRLPGYDSLPEGHLVPVDRHGIPLTSEQREVLRQAWQSTVALSAALQKVADGDMKVHELLLATAPLLSQRIGGLLADAATLVAELQRDEFRAALARVKSDLPRLWPALRQAAGAVGDAAVRRLEEELTRWLSAQGDLAGLLQRAATLQRRWREASAANLVDLGLESLALANAAREAAGSLEPLQAAESLRARLEQAGAALRTQLLRAYDDDEFRELRAAVDLILGRTRAAAGLLARLHALLESKKSAARAPAHPPEAFEVPLEDAGNTQIDLTRAPRRPGDVVRLHASLLRGDQVLQESDASFRVETFGWRGQLSPAVVLARPDRLDGGRDEDFQFAPVLSWLHGYNPRPEETGFAAGFCRGFEPALGLHATFLNFDSQTDVEIGLGATLSFWRGRLQFGGGYNLMADDRGDGRYYFFVGSDLISLLQTIGVANP
jgi:hypothetical protein